MRNIEEILSDLNIWKSKDISYEPLNGGLSNVTYKVFADGTPYVLRINGSQNNFLRLDRGEEAKAIKRTHALGIGTDVLFSNDEILITEFKPGKMLTEKEIHNPFYIKKISGILKAVHSITDINRQCSPFELVDRYITGACKLGVKLPAGLHVYLRKMKAIERKSSRYSSFTKGYCHNDVYCVNILDTNGELCLIDWELSGTGDIFFDLATVSFHSGLTDEEDRLLLEGYFGRYEDEFPAMLYDMKYMNTLREIGWSLLHSGMEKHNINHEFDYQGCAAWFFERLKKGQVSMR